MSIRDLVSARLSSFLEIVDGRSSYVTISVDDVAENEQTEDNEVC
jgi:hypothetical protein